MPAALALTLGEPAGIGPDITFAAWRRRAELDLPPFYLLADPEFIARRASRIPEVAIAVIEPLAAAATFAGALPVVDIGVSVTAEPGRPDRSSAPAAIAALPVMMLWSPELAVVPVTIHLPLREVPARLSIDLIVETGRITARDLRERFGIARPRLAVAGLNPHAGEQGTLGDEDLTLVRPAVERLRAEGIDARGPLPADSLFHEAARARYDVALAMYHDQALIPIKTLA